MLTLTLTADLQGVNELVPQDTPEKNFWYTFKEANEMSGSRGEANFVWKCKSCKRESSASVKAPPVPYQAASPPTRQKIVEFDCRGLELVEFKPEGEWLATGTESGTKFTAIDLTEGEWFDYDEKAGDEVSIKDLNSYQSILDLSSRICIVGEDVVVRLKWGGQTEYIGKLVSIDSYMNIQLAGAEEWIDGEMTSTLGQVLIRCNNVLYISAAPKKNGADTEMQG
ncbi:DUF866 domain protein [Rutstroemia sp. NJR-2017a BBW]|nr:DUF866 domain protein [Rutstroemia sp. NJR-2017a BBW]